MDYQMRHFKEDFKDVVDFISIDGPYDCPIEPEKELRRFLNPGQTNFKAWFHFSIKNKMIFELKDGT